MNLLRIVFLLILATGCAGNVQRQDAADSAQADTLALDGALDSPAADAPASPANAVKRFSGLFSSGNEVSTFRSCDGKTVYWLEDKSGKLSAAYKKATESWTYPYESIFVEVEGYLSGKSDLGYASEYENVLVVTAVKKAEAKNFKTSCYPYEFILLGNEPFWAVDIIPSEGRVVLKDVGEDRVYEFLYSKPAISGGNYTYNLKNPNGESLRINIRRQDCSDGMSDRKYLYSAEVQLKGKTLKGCAIKKGDQLSGQD